IIADKIGTLPSRRPIGLAEGAPSGRLSPHPIPGNDILIGTNGGAFQNPNYPVGFFFTQALAHELGVNLGLRDLAMQSSLPPGFANHKPDAYDPGYKSLMNYTYYAGFPSEILSLGNSAQAPFFADVLVAGNPFVGRNGLADLTGLNFSVVTGTAAHHKRYSIQENQGNYLKTAGSFPKLAADGTVAVLHQHFAETDWEAMQLDFQNHFLFLGHSGLDSYGTSIITNTVAAAGLSQMVGVPSTAAPYIDLVELEQLVGPFDRQAPTLTLNVPAANLTVGQGGTIDIVALATDDLAIADVTVRFDRNGDGTDATSTATNDGASNYSAALTNITGPSGERVLAVTARDTVSRTIVLTRTIRIDGRPAATSTPGAPTPTATPPGSQPTPTRNSNNPASLLYLPLIHGGSG
ncbi:MAG: hypothetical protein KDE58_38000, partial [Caldilineaceae bacterium]|nr:hypothetical protein [Caldilineaceae bacterium]